MIAFKQNQCDHFYICFPFQGFMFNLPYMYASFGL